MSTIEWVDELPPKGHGKGQPPRYGWEAEDEVRARPGHWAKVWAFPAKGSTGKPSSAPYTAANAARKRGFDTAIRASADGNWRYLYLRWPADAPKPRPGSRHVGYPCDHCEEELDTPAALRVHVRKEHPEVTR